MMYANMGSILKKLKHMKDKNVDSCVVCTIHTVKLQYKQLFPTEITIAYIEVIYGTRKKFPADKTAFLRRILSARALSSKQFFAGDSIRGDFILWGILSAGDLFPDTVIYT